MFWLPCQKPALDGLAQHQRRGADYPNMQEVDPHVSGRTPNAIRWDAFGALMT
ncbi:MAG: hypothetical protein AAF754_00880 [Pseudomonadota bacterium]